MEQEAEAMLASIFGALNDPPYDFLIDEALRLVRTYPSLTRQRFDDASGRGQFPLTFLLHGINNLETLQEILNCADSVVVEAEAIYYAAKYGCQPGVLEMLLKRRASKRNAGDTFLNFTLQFILLEGATVNRTDDEKIAILRLVIEANPEAVWRGHSCDGLPLLGQALRGSFGTLMMNFLFREFAQYIDGMEDWVFEIRDRFFHPLSIGRPQAMLLAVLLEKTRTFRCSPGSWEIGGFVCLMDAIGRNDTVDNLEMELPTELFRDYQFLGNAFRNGISGNNTIGRITLDAGAYREDVRREDVRNSSNDDVCLETVLASLGANSSIEDATLVNFRVLQSQALAGFLLNCRIPKLKLKDLYMSSSHDFCFSAECNLQELQLIANLGATWCTDLITRLDRIPKLNNLLLCHESAEGGTPFDVTVSLMASLGQERCEGKLRSLVLRNTTIDLESLAVILKNNLGLQILDISSCNNNNNYQAILGCVARHLETCSTALTCVYTTYSGWNEEDDEIPKELSQIEYMVALNRHGRRSQAMSEDTTLSQLVGLLSSVTTAPRNTMFDDPLERFGGDCKHIIQYGLLRIAPHLWSAT